MNSYQGKGIIFRKLLLLARKTKIGLHIRSLIERYGKYFREVFFHVEWELGDNDAPESSFEPILSGGQVPG